jgi:hypothetical protein
MIDNVSSSIIMYHHVSSRIHTRVLWSDVWNQVAIIAEGVPEQQTRQLIKAAICALDPGHQGHQNFVATAALSSVFPSLFESV